MPSNSGLVQRVLRGARSGLVRRSDDLFDHRLRRAFHRMLARVGNLTPRPLYGRRPLRPPLRPQTPQQRPKVKAQAAASPLGGSVPAAWRSSPVLAKEPTDLFGEAGHLRKRHIISAFRLSDGLSGLASCLAGLLAVCLVGSLSFC